MFDADLPVKLLPFKLITTDANHNHVQHLVLRLQTEFAAEVAEGIGGAAKMARAALISGEMKACRFDIGAVVAHITVADRVLKDARGLRAVAKINQAKEDEAAVPLVVLEFEAPWTDEVLVGLAHETNQNTTARIERKQISLLEGE